MTDDPHHAGEGPRALYLEDLSPGQRFSGNSRVRVEEADVLSFAAQFDPQPFHLDAEAARDSIFGALAASGWHTAALTMRLLVDGDFTPAGGIVGAGFTELKWPRPVFPGDELRVDTEIVDVRASTSRPHQGVVTTRTVTLNQRDEPVQISVGNVIVQRRSTNAD